MNDGAAASDVTAPEIPWKPPGQAELYEWDVRTFIPIDDLAVSKVDGI